jgi:phosphate transport system protein
MKNDHVRSKQDPDMEKLRNLLLLMGGSVEQMISNTIAALIERDSKLAAQVVAMDQDVNALEIAIDEKCLEILAMKKLISRDLRFITLALKIVTDIERMGDKCSNIAKRTMKLNDEVPLKLLIDLPVMSRHAQHMVKQALDSFVHSDEELAYKVLSEDLKVNEMNRQNQEILIDLMQSEPSSVRRAMKFIYVCKSLERIADHATNIAEMVIFMIKGKDIRHSALN